MKKMPLKSVFIRLRPCVTFSESVLLLKLCGNCGFPQNFPTKKSGKILVSYAGMVSLFWLKSTQTKVIYYPLLDAILHVSLIYIYFYSSKLNSTI